MISAWGSRAKATSIRTIDDARPQDVDQRGSRTSLGEPHNKQLQRTVTRRRGDGASAPFHYALAPRFTRQRAAAELRRYVA